MMLWWNDVQCNKSFRWGIFLIVTVINLFSKIKIGIFTLWKLFHVEINLKCTVHKYYLTIYYFFFKWIAHSKSILHYLQSLFIYLISFAILSYSFKMHFHINKSKMISSTSFYLPVFVLNSHENVEFFQNRCASNKHPSMFLVNKKNNQ